MIKINDGLYPISNIKNIAISTNGDEEPVLIYYFLKGTDLMPMTETFKNVSDRDKKIEELLGKKGKTLFG